MSLWLSGIASQILAIGRMCSHPQRAFTVGGWASYFGDVEPIERCFDKMAETLALGLQGNTGLLFSTAKADSSLASSVGYSRVSHSVPYYKHI